MASVHLDFLNVAFVQEVDMYLCVCMCVHVHACVRACMHICPCPRFL